MIDNNDWKEIESAFRIIGLPLPAPEVFLKISYGFLLPIDYYGCLIRIERTRDNEIAPFPIGLIPILSLHLKNELRLALYPSTNSIGVDENDRNVISEMLIASENQFCSGDPADDFAYVSKSPATGFPNGIPTMIDVSDVVDISGYAARKPAPVREAFRDAMIAAQQ